jgi:hypothetical protein
VGGEVGRGTEGGGEGDVLGAGANAAFLSPSADQWFESDALADVERGDALRGLHLVADNGQQVDAQPSTSKRDLTDALGGGGVQEDPVRSCDLGDVVDRLQGAGLVVGVHDGDEHRVRRQGGTNVGWVEATEVVDGQVGDIDVVPPDQMLAGGQEQGARSPA